MPTKTLLKINCVVFFIILSAFAQAEDSTPDLDTLQKEPKPTQKPIEERTYEKGEEHTVEGETEVRKNYIYPSNWGQAGIFRVRSAESLPDGALSFGIGGEFYSVDNPLPAYGLGKANTIAESLFVGYAPTEHVTISVERRNSSTTFGEPQQLVSSLGDFNFSGLYSFKLIPGLSLAPIANILIASNFNNLAPAGQTLSVGAGLAATYGFDETSGLPLFIHANVLYHMPQVRTSKTTSTVEPETFFNFSRFHTITFGLAGEYKIGEYLIPFVEYWNTVHADSGLSFGRTPSKLSVGTRITPLDNKSFALLLGGDIGLGKGVVAGVPFTPDFQVIGQASYTFGITSTERKHYYTTEDVNVVDRKFIIKKTIKFKVAKTELDPESHSLLDQIADVIKQNNVKKLLIAGHTDSSHTEDYNLKLSLDRANAVKRYLVGKGIASETLLTQGYGKRKPRASNATEEGRSQNRRVEFFILE